MRKIVPLMTLTALAALVALAAPPLRSAAQQPAQQQDPRADDAEPAPFNPQMSALMSMLIQPRHAKLGLAGKAENWALAGYAFKELKSGFIVIGKEVPRYKGMPVADLFDAAMKAVFPVMDFAIKAGDPRQFAESFGKITAGCNARPTPHGNQVIV